MRLNGERKAEYLIKKVLENYPEFSTIQYEALYKECLSCVQDDSAVTLEELYGVLTEVFYETLNSKG